MGGPCQLGSLSLRLMEEEEALGGTKNTGGGGGFQQWKILLPSARHLEEGRRTTILELLRRENCISRLYPTPLGTPPPPHTPK